MDNEYIDLTCNILGICNWRIMGRSLPGQHITEDFLYHLFACGLFESVQVKRDFDPTYTIYHRPDMQKFVQERDRLEIRRLRAELESVKARKI